MPRTGKQGKNSNKGKVDKGKQHLRLPEDDLEVLVNVDTILGNGMFYAKTSDGTQLLGHIRGKHRGRNKRDNLVVKGSIVLVGLRDYEYPNYKECDLLHVYAMNEIHLLSQQFDLHDATSQSASSSSASAAAVVFEEQPDEEQIESSMNTTTYLGETISLDDI
jgi:initiation factor 1A